MITIILPPLLLSVSSTIHGLLLRSSFHHGDECDMTYSRYNYIRVPLPPSSHDTIGSCYAGEDDIVNDVKETNDDEQDNGNNLYRFVDAGDERAYSILNPSNHDENNNHINTNDSICPFNDDETIILFLPGHFGSHTQSRSIGAHGLGGHGMTRTFSEEKLTMKYATYAVSFEDDWSAFPHASVLYNQAEFVVDVIEYLGERCGGSGNRNETVRIRKGGIIMVGHSFGGIVARLAMTMITNSSSLSLVKGLVTLATPHLYQPYSIHPSFTNLYRRLKEEEKKDIVNNHQIPLVSFSGGWRDELIPPFSVEYFHDRERRRDGRYSSYTALMHDIMPWRIDDRAPSRFRDDNSMTIKARKGRFGIDHRAISWCHNGLEVVGEAIRILATNKNNDIRNGTGVHTTDTALCRLVGVTNCEINDVSVGNEPDDDHNSDYDHQRRRYKTRILEDESAIRDEYGRWGSSSLLSVQAYNLPAVIGFYVWHTVFYIHVYYLVVGVVGAGDVNRTIVLSNIILYAFSPIIVGMFMHHLYHIHGYADPFVTILVSYTSMNLYWLVRFILKIIAVVERWRRLMSRSKIKSKTKSKSTTNFNPFSSPILVPLFLPFLLLIFGTIRPVYRNWQRDEGHVGQMRTARYRAWAAATPTSTTST